LTQTVFLSNRMLTVNFGIIQKSVNSLISKSGP